MQRVITKRERLILFITACVFMFSLAFNFLIYPLYSRTKSLDKEINLTRLKLKKYAGLLGRKEQIRNRYKNFIPLNQVDENKDPVVSALSELEQIAKDANIHIVDIRPDTAKNLDLYKEILIEIKTQGNIDDYMKFLYDIENSLTLLKVKKFQLGAKPNTQSLEGNFSISQISPSD